MVILITREMEETGFSSRCTFPYTFNGVIVRQESYYSDRVIFSNPNNGRQYCIALQNIILNDPINEPGGYNLEFLIRTLQEDKKSKQGLIAFYSIKKNGDMVSLRYHAGKMFSDNHGNLGKIHLSAHF